MKISDLFELRGQLSKTINIVIGLIGFCSLMTIWIVITACKWVVPQILPSPFKVFTAFGQLHFHYELVRNLFFSMYLNVAGYAEAVIVSLIAGFLMGLFPVVNSLFSKYVNAIRFLPLTAVIGLFMAWFGIDNNMKIQFLAVGIIVYLIPTVIQRINEVDNIYDQTAVTLGASLWQRIRYVFIPAAMSKISDDIKVLVAISWTYIIVAEMVNATRGIGPLVFLAGRQGKSDLVFALLIVIIMVGFLQDKVLESIDRLLFKYKYIR
jgi:NitT/TauT family transport system permease protein